MISIDKILNFIEINDEYDILWKNSNFDRIFFLHVYSFCLFIQLYSINNESKEYEIKIY